MTQIEFISYIPTPQEKHIGIATVKLYGKIILRYKIVKNRDNTTFFPGAPSCKVVQAGEDRYLPAHQIDSRSENDDVEAFIRLSVRKAMQALGQEIPEQQHNAQGARQTVPNNPPAQFHQAPAQQQYTQPYAAPAAPAQYLNDCPF